MLNKSKSYTTGDRRSFVCRVKCGPSSSSRQIQNNYQNSNSNLINMVQDKNSHIVDPLKSTGKRFCFAFYISPITFLNLLKFRLQNYTFRRLFTLGYKHKLKIQRVNYNRTTTAAQQQIATKYR